MRGEQLSLSLGRSVAWVVVVLALAGCGAEVPPAGTTAITSAFKDPAEATMEEMSPCPPMDFTPTEGVDAIPYVVQWSELVTDDGPRYEVVAMDPPDPNRLPPRVEVTVRDLHSDNPEALRRSMSGDDSKYLAIQWALAHDARVVVGSYADHASADIIVANLVIIQPRTGRPFFAGECAERDIAGNLVRIFGDDYTQTVQRLTTGPITLPKSPPPPVVFLLDGEAPQKLLDSLEHVTVQFRLPKSWAGAELDDRYALATHVTAGWNEALPLTWDNPDPTSTRIGAYLPARGHIDLVILGGDGDINKQVRTLARLDAAEMLAAAAKGARDNSGVAEVVIDTDVSAQEVLDPTTPVIVRIQSP